jgi:membrane protein implicated in regulation of membrane protease activity
MLLLGAILLAVFVLPDQWDLPVVLLAAVVEVGETGFWLWYSRRRRVQVGPETLIGATALVVAPCRPAGRVRIEGELWRARCEEGADIGDEVRVLALDELTLVVERAA